MLFIHGFFLRMIELDRNNRPSIDEILRSYFNDYCFMCIKEDAEHLSTDSSKLTTKSSDDIATGYDSINYSFGSENSVNSILGKYFHKINLIIF